MDSASRQINVGEALGRQLVDMVREVARRTLRGKLNKSELSNVEDDIVGEATYKIIRAMKCGRLKLPSQMDDMSQLYSYIATTLNNLRIDYVKRKHSRREESLSLEQCELQCYDTLEDNIWSLLPEAKEMLLSALCSFDRIHLQGLLSGMNAEQIADLLQISRATYYRLRRESRTRIDDAARQIPVLLSGESQYDTGT